MPLPHCSEPTLSRRGGVGIHRAWGSIFEGHKVVAKVGKLSELISQKPKVIWAPPTLTQGQGRSAPDPQCHKL